jgi:hypothetical protein
MACYERLVLAGVLVAMVSGTVRAQSSVDIGTIAQVCAAADTIKADGARGRQNINGNIAFEFNADQTMSVFISGRKVESITYSDYSKCVQALAISLRPPKLDCTERTQVPPGGLRAGGEVELRLSEEDIKAGYKAVAKWCVVGQMNERDANGYALIKSDVGDNGVRCQFTSSPARSITAHIVMCRIIY